MPRIRFSGGALRTSQGQCEGLWGVGDRVSHHDKLGCSSQSPHGLCDADTSRIEHKDRVESDSLWQVMNVIRGGNPHGRQGLDEVRCLLAQFPGGRLGAF